MIVVDELGNGPSEVALAERNDPIETFLFDRSYEPLRVGIRIGCLKRCLHDAEADLLQQPWHLPTPFPIPIADQQAMVTQQSVIRGRERDTRLGA